MYIYIYIYLYIYIRIYTVHNQYIIMYIRLSTYLYGCRFCSDALDLCNAAVSYGPSKLITAFLQLWVEAKGERIQTTPLPELGVWWVLYISTCDFFATFSHPSFVFLASMVSMRHFAVLLPLAFGKPHVLFVLVDDLGWANVGFNRDPPIPKSVVTPNLDRLAGH